VNNLPPKIKSPAFDGIHASDPVLRATNSPTVIVSKCSPLSFFICKRKKKTGNAKNKALNG